MVELKDLSKEYEKIIFDSSEIITEFPDENKLNHLDSLLNFLDIGGEFYITQGVLGEVQDPDYITYVQRDGTKHEKNVCERTINLLNHLRDKSLILPNLEDRFKQNTFLEQINCGKLSDVDRELIQYSLGDSSTALLTSDTLIHGVWKYGSNNGIYSKENFGVGKRMHGEMYEILTADKIKRKVYPKRS